MLVVRWHGALYACNRQAQVLIWDSFNRVIDIVWMASQTVAQQMLRKVHMPSGALDQAPGVHGDVLVLRCRQNVTFPSGNLFVPRGAFTQDAMGKPLVPCFISADFQKELGWCWGSVLLPAWTQGVVGDQGSP